MVHNVPHYQVRFLDGLTPFDCRSIADVDTVFHTGQFDNRTMIVRGVNIPNQLTQLIGQE
jgi:hypothetical protein